jgi:acyl-homoserine lactone acylase PvdQ
VDQHPQQVNPPSGYLVSWNNKQAPQFSAADDQWGYGPVHRSLAISDRLAALAKKGGVQTTDVVAAVQGAATVDSRAFYTLPSLLDVIGDDPDAQVADAVTLLRDWQRSGAHRIDQDRNGSYEDQAAVALFDTWWGGEGEEGVAQDLLRGTLGNLVGELPQRRDDHPRQGLGSSWNGAAWYGYVRKDLDVVRGQTPGAWSRAYCGHGDLTTCQADLRGSLKAAVAKVLAEQDVSSVDQLTYDKHIDDIRSTTAGLVGVRPIDWQNRPTFQQVVDYSGHRPR